jgi:DNA-binding beta-propeller fold protein YncE
VDGLIDRYQVAANGALTHLGVTVSPEPFGIAISPDGRTIYVTNFDVGGGHGAVSNNAGFQSVTVRRR